MATLERLLSRLPADDNLRGHAFEPIAKWYLENDPVQKSQFRQVWRVEALAWCVGSGRIHVAKCWTRAQPRLGGCRPV